MSEANLSFDIKTPRDMLAKLRAEQAALEADLTSARHAINAAMTAWHLLEWVWGLEVKGSPSVRRKLGAAAKDLKSFRAYVLERCPAIETMQCVSEGSKHVGGTTGSRVTATRIHGGAFSSEFSKDFDISRLRVETADGSSTSFDVELAAVVQFWAAFFDEYLATEGDCSG